MSGYTISRTVASGYDATVAAVRDALADQGFGVLTEIDVRATMKAKLDEDVPPQIILGACRPQLAHQALQAEPSIGALLPCNVVVRADSAEATESVVEAVDPEMLVRVTGNDSLCDVSAEVGQRLRAALDALPA